MVLCRNSLVASDKTVDRVLLSLNPIQSINTKGTSCRDQMVPRSTQNSIVSTDKYPEARKDRLNIDYITPTLWAKHFTGIIPLGMGLNYTHNDMKRKSCGENMTNLRLATDVCMSCAECRAASETAKQHQQGRH